jgi:hypothetical protein
MKKSVITATCASLSASSARTSLAKMGLAGTANRVMRRSKTSNATAENRKPQSLPQSALQRLLPQRLMKQKHFHVHTPTSRSRMSQTNTHTEVTETNKSNHMECDADESPYSEVAYIAAIGVALMAGAGVCGLVAGLVWGLLR